MKYGQILMNSDRGAVQIIINFLPPLPHFATFLHPSSTPVASSTSLLGQGEEHPSNHAVSPFLP